MLKSLFFCIKLQILHNLFIRSIVLFVEKSLLGPELLSRTVHKALTIDPHNCFEHNHFNYSKSVNLTRTTKALVNRRRLHNRREFAGEVA